jgi:peptidoglycan/xylan/chitin deacetylase (PgdA/CDA1 family)
MILKKILSFAASIIKLIILISFTLNSNAEENNSKYYPEDLGTLSLMYHRFNENKYPSTNIQIEIFKKQIEIIKKNNFEFNNPVEFDLKFFSPKSEKKILITIDDAFSSFYQNAWPYLKENKIPFILFVSTEPIGKFGYMNWKQIKEIDKEDFAFIGNHSHSHKYLVNFDFEEFKKDIDQSIKIFEEKLGYNPIYFSYPFGEYSLKQKNYISQKFKYAFGQHSGVIDINKDKFELPRFPINEKYGDLKRFKFLLNLLPLQYKTITPEEKFITNQNNPPEMIVEFFNEQENLNLINCFSNEGKKWDKSEIKLDKKKLVVKFREKFLFRRGRINCSLNDSDGWRWFGIQFSIEKN